MKIICSVFSTLYLLALAVLAVGTFGLFGQERDPLSAVFLVPLGVPWIWLADRLGMGGAPVLILAPLINLAILFVLARWHAKRRIPTSSPNP